MDKEIYMKECLGQLEGIYYYHEITVPIYTSNIDPINKILNSLISERFLTPKQYQFLCAKLSCRLRQFYILPKIHKPKSSWPLLNRMPPGRQIVSDCSSESYNVSD